MLNEFSNIRFASNIVSRGRPKASGTFFNEKKIKRVKENVDINIFYNIEECLDLFECDLCNKNTGKIEECDSCGFRFHKNCNGGIKCESCD